MPQSIEPWTFYEEVDNFLGPWGNSGYPIGYGKYYCVAFNSNEKLRANPQTADWIRRTTIVLQEALRDFIMIRGSRPERCRSSPRKSFAITRSPVTRRPTIAAALRWSRSSPQSFC